MANISICAMCGGEIKTTAQKLRASAKEYFLGIRDTSTRKICYCKERFRNEDYCLHYATRDSCGVGRFCSCESPVPSSTYYKCAYGPCEGHKCEKCGRFL